ncbi:GWT1-domain-containing protein [Russula earlei]|uniref:GWT1-domain-containing protein n=1 Tax=Russula earlei TaxID=71964 RepID=A0ACC0U2X2_9AGAM|nr:GWT1-domain-containing protein [Russula earlei]
MVFTSYNDDYKQSKEAFVSGTTGSTVSHVNMMSLAAFASIALHSAVRSRFPPHNRFLFLSECLLLVAPLLLSMTLFADRPGALSAALLLPTTLICFLIPPHQSGTPLPFSGVASPRGSPSPSPRTPGFHHDEPSQHDPAQAEKPERTRLSALSTYRAHMMLMTVLAILAVDFPVFPRSLAKCETFGVSLMDMGVGSFVFSQGIVSARSVIQSFESPPSLRPPLLLETIWVLAESTPVLLLGLVRVLLVKSTDYPEHVTEYGVHWNFFLTLALIPVLRVHLLPLIASMPISLLGLLVASAHQLSLSAGLTSYVLNAPRQTLISANKEGIVSLTGYLAIHLLGLSTGTLIIPHSTSYFRRLQAAMRRLKSKSETGEYTRPSAIITEDRISMPIPRENDKTATVLFSYAVIYWTLFGITRYLHIGGPDVSRRLVNISYIAWVAGCNTTALLFYFLLDLVFFPTPLAKSTYSPVSGLKVGRRANSSNDNSNSASPKSSPPSSVPPRRTRSSGTTIAMAGPSPMPAPPLLEAINRNSLAVFLLANVATGVVNLSMQTMYASDRRAMCVLSAYALFLCAFAWAVRERRLVKL